MQVPPSLPAVLADVTDTAFFTAERVAAWGAVDALISSIPCTSVSRLGKRDGLTDGTFEFAADLRYRGQEHTIAIPAEKPEDLSTDISGTAQKFNALHDRRYGHAAPDQSIEIVNLRLVVTIARMQDVIAKWMSEPWQPSDAAPEQRRSVVFDDPKKPVDASIVWRPGLPAGTEIVGPAVIEEPNSTTWLPPGDRAVVDPSGHIIITLAGLS